MKRALVVWLAMAACGPTVGDPCTTASDCLGQLCFNTASVPGGYCSESCNPGDPNSCPAGTTCVNMGGGQKACFRTCHTASDCRSGYVCEVQNSSSSAICIGPKGL